MIETALFPYAVGIISALGASLVAVLVFIGGQINAQLKVLGAEMKETNTTLTKIERDLRGELSRLDRRVAVVESRCGVSKDREST